MPFLLGLDALTKFKVALTFDDKVMRSKLDGWLLPLVHKNRHMYIELVPSVLITERELRRAHRHFFHPQPTKLLSLMNPANPAEVSPNLLSDIEMNSATCELCQKEADAPHHFRVAFPEAYYVFNRTVYM